MIDMTHWSTSIRQTVISMKQDNDRPTIYGFIVAQKLVEFGSTRESGFKRSNSTYLKVFEQG